MYSGMSRVGLSHPHLQRDASTLNFFIHIPLDLYKSVLRLILLLRRSLIFIYNRRRSRKTSSPYLSIKTWKNSTSPQVKIMWFKLDVPLLAQVLSINYNKKLVLETFHMYSACFSRQRNYKTDSRKEVNVMAESDHRWVVSRPHVFKRSVIKTLEADRCHLDSQAELYNFICFLKRLKE